MKVGVDDFEQQVGSKEDEKSEPHTEGKQVGESKEEPDSDGSGSQMLDGVSGANVALVLTVAVLVLGFGFADDGPQQPIERNRRGL